MAQDQELLWTTKGQKTASKEHLHPHSLYDFFSNANAARLQQGRPVQRIRSAAPRIGGNNHDINIRSGSVRSPLGSFTSLRNPSPTPATSRPLSSRSGISSVSSWSAQKTKPTSSKSPTSLYLGFHKARCKSAPPRPADYYLPQRPKTAKSRVGSAVSSSRSAPKRAWQNRTSSAKSQHSLLSRREIEKRHKERCKSAPLPYDFSCIEVVNSVPEQGSDIQRLQAFTRPLTCMPDVVQNVLSHNGLRHCCSAYQPRPKTVCSSRQQFWPVARPAVFHRGDVPKYLHFVKPAGFWIKGEEARPRTAPGDSHFFVDDQNDISGLLLQGEDDEEGTVLYEEQFVVPATPSEESLSDQEELAASRASTVDELQLEVDLDASPREDLSDGYLNEGREVEEQNSSDHITPDATPEQRQRQSPDDDQTSEPADHDQGIQVIITRVESPVRSPSPKETELEPVVEIPCDEQKCDLDTVVPEIPQWAAKEEVSPVEEEVLDQDPSEQDIVPQVNQEPEVPVVPVKEVQEVQDVPPKEAIVNEESKVEEVKPQINQVKFADSLVLTSYKSLQPKKEKKEQPMKPVSILKPIVTKVETPSSEQKIPSPVPQKKATPVMERKVPDKPLQVKPLVKPAQEVGGKAEKKEEKKPAESEVKVAEERMEEPHKLEPDVLPRPEYIRARGAYRMYDPKDLLEHHLEQKRESRPVKKSLTSTTSIPQFRPSSENSEVMTTILDEQKRRREGMKPWLQGRLALSKQTSRFELPMDVRLLEAMTPMEYLTKYCIISTRRKALYKHIFQKVDRDRDNKITFKEMDRGLREIHVDSITTEQVKKLIEMVEGNEKSTFNLAQFSAVAAFSERFLFLETQVTEKNSAYSSKDVIEEADFCGLKYKLSGFSVNPTVRKILEVL